MAHFVVRSTSLVRDAESVRRVTRTALHVEPRQVTYTYTVRRISNAEFGLTNNELKAR